MAKNGQKWSKPATYYSASFPPRYCTVLLLPLRQYLLSVIKQVFSENSVHVWSVCIQEWGLMALVRYTISHLLKLHHFNYIKKWMDFMGNCWKKPSWFIKLFTLYTYIQKSEFQPILNQKSILLSQNLYFFSLLC